MLTGWYRHASMIVLTATGMVVGCATGGTTSGNGTGTGRNDASTADTSGSGDGSSTDDSSGDDSMADTSGTEIGTSDATCGGAPGLSVNCGKGACAKSVAYCPGDPVPACTPGTPGTEMCDGKDEDCDGIVDDIDAKPCTLPTLKGVCAQGAQACPSSIGLPDPGDAGMVESGAVVHGPDGSAWDGATAPVSGSSNGAICVQTVFPTPEICNGKDDDCNGKVDDGDPAVMCPPTAHVATTSCTSGACQIVSCATGWFNFSGTYATGCDCQDSTVSHACNASTTDLGSITAGAAPKTVTTVSPVPGRDDWYHVTFTNVTGNSAAHPKIDLTTNPGATFVISVYYKTCGGAISVCGATEASVTAEQTWETSYTGLTGTTTDPSFQPLLAAALTGADASIYFKVSYKTAAPATCSPYTLTISE